MGWARGSEFVERVARVVVEEVDGPDARAAVFNELVQAALDGDCDTLDECRGIDPELDLAIDTHWGVLDDWDDEEDED